jgi:[protein-PII] uridylyltransferase
MIKTQPIDSSGKAAERLKGQREMVTRDLLQHKGAQLLVHQSDILDAYFQDSFENSLIGPAMDIIKNPYAIIALGGYGRQEQCYYSDIDLLFLFRKKIPQTAENLIREVVYPLWDLGFEVGYATRSFSESLSWAKKDYEILTSMLDARFICGVSVVFSELMEKFRNRVLGRQSRKVVSWLVDRNLERHAQFGDSSYLLEPNLKEGQGGLRDYHTMLWIGKIKAGFKQARDLEYHGHFSHKEFRALQEALGFIWSVRNHLHYLAGRKLDHMYLEHQIKLSQTLQFKQSAGLKPVEQFLGELHGHMETVKQQHLMFLYEMGFSRKVKRVRRPKKETRHEGLTIQDGQINFTGPEQIVKAPILLLHIFEESARLKMPLNPEAKRLANEFAHLVDDRLRADTRTVKSFEKILNTPSPIFDALNEMLKTGLLEAIIPEFKKLINRIQYNEYHIYPVARHSLRTVRTLKSLGTPEAEADNPLSHRLYKEIRLRKLLLWAGLLHDIGKGQPGGDHSSKGAEIARRLLTQMGYGAKEVDTVTFLVREHLLLIKTATRRDLNDEETALSCARKIPSINHLKMLYLLTVADSIATGPKAWNSWTSLLLRDLFLKVHGIMDQGELASRRALRSSERKKEEALKAFAGSDDHPGMTKLVSVMSPRYLLSMNVKQMQAHMALYSRLKQNDFVWDIQANGSADTRTVTICAKDRPGLFSKIAGIFTLNGVDILASQIFTWRNNIALDIFEVKPPPDQIFEKERWAKAETHLRAALKDELDLSRLVGEKIRKSERAKGVLTEEPHRVVVDNDSSSFFTIIEVFTYDFPGLLFSITDALFRSGMDIWVAKIATKIDQVVDVFYIRDFDGQKITHTKQVEALRSAIMQVLTQWEP